MSRLPAATIFTATIFTATALVLTAIIAPAFAQDDTGFGGTSGPDLSIEAIEPEKEALAVGFAGDAPADIGRFLLANGAGNAQLSPNGQSIAFSSSITGAPQIWIIALTGPDAGSDAGPAIGGQPRQLTFGNGISFFRWSSDGKGLLYGADNDGNEQQGYFFIASDGSSEKRVFPAKGGTFRVFGDFAADGQTFVYASTARNGLDFDIYRATLSGEDALVYKGSYGNFARSLSPDGRYAIVTQTVGEDGDNLQLLDLKSGAIKTVSQPASRANHGDGGFAWLADSRGFYFATDREREFKRLAFYTLANGRISEVDSAEKADIGDVTLCGPKQRYLAWVAGQNGRDTLVIHDRENDRKLAVPQIPQGVYSIDCAGENGRILLRISSYNRPGDLYMLDIASGDLTRSYRSNLAGLDAGNLVPGKSVRMTARDGVELQGMLYLPQNAADTPPPVLFLVHGGPTGESRAGWDPIVQYHVGRGVAVFEPNVRGSTGFGRSYVKLDDREKRLDSVRDLVDMLDALGSQGLVDKERAIVAGGSYGGYMVNAVLAAYPDSFAAGISLFGVADWITALEVASPALKAADRIEYGDISEQKWRDFYSVNSPIRQADQIRVPVLYSHGVKDPRIDIAETETMVKILRANGIDAPFIRIPDEGHGWRKLSNRLFYYRREAQFIEAQLGLSGDAPE